MGHPDRGLLDTSILALRRWIDPTELPEEKAEQVNHGGARLLVIATPNGIRLHSPPRFRSGPIFYQDFYRNQCEETATHPETLAGPGTQAFSSAPGESFFQAGHAGSIPVIRSVG